MVLKRAFTLFLAALTLCACGAFAEGGFTMAGFDGENSNHVWSENGFFARMRERTGVELTLTQYTQYDKWRAAKAEMFSGGEMPDALFKAALTTDELIGYTDSGQIIDLMPLLPECAPNLWRVLNDDPEWLRAITLPNGKIGALPGLTRQPTQNAMWINRLWLERLGLDMPTDADSLREVLTAFKEKDPNQNGKRDEVPLAFLGSWDLKFLSHAFGLVANDYNVYVDEGGAVRYLPLTDGFFDLIRFLRSLQTDGLLDPEGFYTSDTLRTITDEKAAQVYGMMFGPSPMTIIPYSQYADYALLPPLMFGGKRVYRALTDGVTRGAFAITSACDNPAALLNWVDVLYTEQGAIEALAGRENENYEFTDGFWDWKGGRDALAAGVLNDLTIYDTGDMPWLFPLDFYNLYQDEGVRRVSDDLTSFISYCATPFPICSLTSEQRAVALEKQGVLGPYVDVSIAKFVLGQTALDDESINAFKSELLALGAGEFTAFWQEVYDSYAQSGAR